MGKVGLCFVNPVPQIQPGFVSAMAKKCEELGLDSFWSIDRIAYDNLEPLTLLATAAAVTKRIRLGTSVFLPAVRHPAIVAKTVASLDFLSGGRVTMGIGVGSRPNDFSAVGLPFEGRGSRAEEAIKLIRRLWTEENVTHQGRFFQVTNLTIGPRPIQSPHPPIWMGGSADTALKRTARLATGYICSSSAIQEFHSVWQKIEGFARAAGRNAAEIEKACLTFMVIDDNKAKAIEACEAYVKRYYGTVRMDVEKLLLVGSAEACAERIQATFAKGIQTLIIGVALADLRQVDLFGEKVLPLVKS